MSRSDRYGNLTLALIAGAVFVFMMLLFVAVVSEHRTQLHRIYEDYQQNAAKERRKAADEAASTCVGMEADAFTKCVSDQITAYYNQQTANQDLKAQQEMALWAFWMFIASCGTVLIAGVGIYYIRRTLEETRKASEAGSVAARASQDAVITARENAERELRAYVCIEHAKWKPVESSIQTSITFKNFGQTPAYDITIQCTALVDDLNGAPEFAPWDDKAATKQAVLGPSAHTTEFPVIPGVGPELLEKVRKGQYALYAYGEVRYRDAFKHSRFTRFRFACGGTFGFVGDYMASCPEGNEAN